jgi:rubredoxin
MKSYMCVICGYIYNEAEGVPDEGIDPGTAWDDVPPNWVCPDCGARKEDFEMVEI